MTQIIEGVDNEVTVIFCLLTGMFAILIPWYLFRPRYNSSTSRSTSSAVHSTVQNTGSFNQHHNLLQADINNANFTSSSPRPLENINEQVQVDSIDTGEPQVPSSSPLNSAGSSPDGPGTMGGTDITSPGPIGFEHLVNNENSNISDQRQGHDSWINVRVKHGESDTSFHISRNMLLGDFKRHCFPTEVEQGKLVRLIFGGRILQEDNQPLHSLGIQDDCAVHAHISEVQQPAPGDHSSRIEDLEIGHLMVPLLTIGLLMGWLAVFVYDDIFSSMSLVILAFLTVLFLLLAFIL